MTIDLNAFTGGVFAIKDAFINYYEGYIGIGMSADFSNSTFLKNHTNNKLSEGVKKLVGLARKNPLQCVFGSSLTSEWAMPKERSVEDQRSLEELDEIIGNMMANGDRIKQDFIESNNI
jgi:hypothetical protein